MSFLVPSNLDISVYTFSNPDRCFEACVLLTVLLTQPLWQESQLQNRTYYERPSTNLVSTHRHLELRTHSILGSSLEISVLDNFQSSGCGQGLDSQYQSQSATKCLQTETGTESRNLPYFPVPCVQLTAKQVGWDCCLFSFLTGKEKAKTLSSG